GDKRNRGGFARRSQEQAHLFRGGAKSSAQLRAAAILCRPSVSLLLTGRWASLVSAEQPPPPGPAAGRRTGTPPSTPTASTVPRAASTRAPPFPTPATTR